MKPKILILYDKDTCIEGHLKSINTGKNKHCKLCDKRYNSKRRITSKIYWQRVKYYKYRDVFIKHLKNRYNCSIETYAWLLYQSNFKCSICSATQNLHLDHDHKTGELRGFLCRFHNHLLGKLEVFSDDIKLLNIYREKSYVKT